MKKIGIITLVVIVLGATIATSVYFYIQNQKLQKKVAAENSSDEVAKLIEKVSKHILLPSDEKPTVMTVTDKEKLSGMVFFAHAKNGDKVLVYQGEKKAYLYDPDRDMVLEVGPVVLASPSAGATPISQTDQEEKRDANVRFVLFNGTSIPGIAESYQNSISPIINPSQILYRAYAKNRNYKQTVIVDLKGTHPEETAQYSKSLGIATSDLPSGEIATGEADFLIIVGEDKK